MYIQQIISRLNFGQNDIPCQTDSGMALKAQKFINAK